MKKHISLLLGVTLTVSALMAVCLAKLAASQEQPDYPSLLASPNSQTVLHAPESEQTEGFDGNSGTPIIGEWIMTETTAAPALQADTPTQTPKAASRSAKHTTATQNPSAPSEAADSSPVPSPSSAPTPETAISPISDSFPAASIADAQPSSNENAGEWVFI